MKGPKVIKRQYVRLLCQLDHNLNPLNLWARLSGRRQSLWIYRIYENRIWKPIRKWL